MSPYKLTVDQQAKLTAAEIDETLWRRDMLENSIRQTVLMEAQCEDHREFRKLLYKVAAYITAIGAVLGVSVGVVV